MVETYAEGLVLDAADTFYVRIVGIGIVGSFIPIKSSGGSPVGAIESQWLVVDEVSTDFKWRIGCGYSETYLVV